MKAKLKKQTLRRRLLPRQRKVEDLSSQAEEQLEKHLIQRFGRLVAVRRFVVTWTLLFILLMGGVVVQIRGLSKFYLAAAPVPGGTYTEGVVGAFTNANPLYATSLVDTTVSRLVFSGLFEFNERGELTGDLAEGFETDEVGLVYTVKLKPDLKWHDGRNLTAEDVLFTYRTIQNPDARSPLLRSWQGITVKAVDERTITFTLPNTLASFPHSMVNGIVPKHVLEDIPLPQLRSVSFNTVNPIGSGPFKWNTLEVHGTSAEDREEVIGLVANTEYHGTVPRLGRFVVRTFRSKDRLIKSLEQRELNAAVGLDSMPDTLAGRQSFIEHSIPVNGQIMAFYNNSNAILADVKVRQALTKAINTYEIAQGLSYPAIAAKGPLLQSHIGYNPALTQFEQNIEEASRLLNESGWVVGEDGIRVKDGAKLILNLYSQNTSEYVYVAQRLQKMWRDIGIEVQSMLPEEAAFQEVLSRHGYDILLYGISVGRDPDVFPFWHSSQADLRSANRLNFSEYNSDVADAALEAGRTRSDDALRSVKYRPFLEVWRNDAPALALYQPRLLYITYGEVHEFNVVSVSSSADRFAGVENWMIREEKSLK